MDQSDPDNFRRAIDGKTRCLFLETIGNPRLDVPDFEAISQIAREGGAIVRDALGATDTLLPGEPVRTAGRIARAWGALEAGRVREGAAALGTASSALLEEAGRGTLPPRSAALFLCAVALGLVGASPDATRDRMVLRPRLAADLLPFSARRIRAADALFDLNVAMDAERWVATLEQSAGSVPLQVVLNAWLASPAFREIRVDGRTADLDAVPLDGGWVLPVQLVPDRPRRVEVVLETSAGPS